VGRDRLQRRRHGRDGGAGAGRFLAPPLADAQAAAQYQRDQVVGIDRERAAQRRLFRRLVSHRQADHRQVQPLLDLAPVDLHQALEQAARPFQVAGLEGQVGQRAQRPRVAGRVPEDAFPELAGTPSVAPLCRLQRLAFEGCDRCRICLLHDPRVY
jgi:hypothetical protein